MVKKLTIYGVLKPFLGKPHEKLHLADISRGLNQPHPTVRLWLNMLEKKGVLRKEYKGRLTLYYLNIDNPLIIEYLVISEKERILEIAEKYPEIIEIISWIQKNGKENTKALIFGSAADIKTYSNANDIDLLVVGKDNLNGLRKVSSRLNKKLHIIKVSNLRKVSKALRIEIIKNHLIINGGEEIVRWFLW